MTVYAEQEEYDLEDIDYICICGAHLPCRHEDDANHGIGSYFRNPIFTDGPMLIRGESDASKARLVLKKTKGSSDPACGEVWRSLVTYGMEP